MADGCISRSRELIVVVHRRDEAHLQALMRFLGCDDRVLRPANGGTARRLSIGSAELGRRLTDLGIVPGRAGAEAGVLEPLARSRHFWRGIVDGDGSIRIQRRTGAPSMSVVGTPGLMRQFAEFLATIFADNFRPRPHLHGQSGKVLIVSLGGRHAVTAIRTLYVRAPDALARKRSRAEQAMAWQPRFRSRYPWSRWSDGESRVLTKGTDYDDRRRLWEAGRRVARSQGKRLELIDLDDARVSLRFAPREYADTRASRAS